MIASAPERLSVPQSIIEELRKEIAFRLSATVPPKNLGVTAAFRVRHPVDLWERLIQPGEALFHLELYQRLVSSLIPEPNRDLKLRVLSGFAFERFFTPRNDDFAERFIFTADDLVSHAAFFLKGEASDQSCNSFVTELRSTELLCELEDGRLAFSRLTVHEYLAALELASRNDCREWFVRTYFDRPLAEMETLPMSLGLVEDPNVFYDLLAELPDSIDFIGLRLQARGLGYCHNVIRNSHHKRFTKRLTSFVLGNDLAELAFAEVVVSAFSNAHESRLTDLAAALVAMLDHSEADVRGRAVNLLGVLETKSPEVIAGLRMVLGDQDEKIRTRAAEVLVEAGDDSPAVAPTLLTALRNQDYDVQMRAMDALERLGGGVPGVVEGLLVALQDTDEELRKHAVSILGTIGSGKPEVVAALFTVLHDTGDDVAWQAEQALGRIGKQTPEILPKVLALLDDHDWPIRLAGVGILGEIGIRSPEVVQELVCRLSDRDEFVRDRAAEVLGHLGIETPEFNFEANVLSSNQFSDVQKQSTKIMEVNEPATPESVADLLASLRLQSLERRRKATKELVKIGEGNPAVIEGLILALEDDFKDVRRRAATALGQLGVATDAVVSILTDALGGHRSDVRHDAAVALGKLGVGTPEVITWLFEAVSKGFTRDFDSFGLVQHWAWTPAAFAGLLAALHTRDTYRQSRTVEELQKIGLDLPDIVAGMKYLLGLKDAHLTRLALRGIGYPSTDSALLYDLQRLTGEVEPVVRDTAIEMVAKYKKKLEVLELLPE